MAKKNMRNEFEFMSAVLDALGVEYEEADIKQRERWRSKVLDGWGVKYELDDLKQFERWRKKCLEGLAKGGGGGTNWTVLYDGTVNMSYDSSSMHYIGNVPNIYTDADQIRVTYDGVTYTLDKKDYYGSPIYGGYTGGENFDFIDYPFVIKFDHTDGMKLYTIDDASTHSVKVEIPQNGCNYSTAQVTLINDEHNMDGYYISIPNLEDGDLFNDVLVPLGESQTVTAVLYNGRLIFHLDSYLSIDTGESTGAYVLDDTYITISGDCTLVILGPAQ